MNILKEPHELLHQKCQTVTDFGKARAMADDLVKTVRSIARFWNPYLGFAANQIGHSYRIIVLRAGKDTFEIMINPEIVEKKIPFPYLEKCYSVKGIYLVKRYLLARVKYLDLEGNPKERILSGFSAIYQEIDHIDGILVSETGTRVF